MSERPGFAGERRNELIQIIRLLGAEYMRVLDRKSTHLVGPHRLGPPRHTSSTGLNLSPGFLRERERETLSRV